MARPSPKRHPRCSGIRSTIQPVTITLGLLPGGLVSDAPLLRSLSQDPLQLVLDVAREVGLVDLAVERIERRPDRLVVRATPHHEERRGARLKLLLQILDERSVDTRLHHLAN